MALSWVAGSEKATGGGTDCSVTTPSGIANGDAILYFLVCRHPSDYRTVTPPSGWSEAITPIDYVSAGWFHRLYVFSKDTVTSGNSSTAYTFTADASTSSHGALAVIRPSLGNVEIANDYDYVQTFAASGSITIGGAEVLTATSDDEVFIILTSLGSGSQFTTSGDPVAPTGATRWTTGATGGSDPNTDYRYHGAAYQLRDTAETNHADGFSWSSTTYDSTTFTFRLLEGGIPTTYEDEIAEGVGTNDALTTQGQYPGVIVEPVNIGNWWGIYADERSVSDAMGVSVRRMLANMRSVRAESDEIGIEPAVAYNPGATIAQAIGMLDVMSPQTTYGWTLSQIIGTSEVLRSTWPRVVDEEVGIEPAVLTADAVRVLEELGLRPVLGPAVSYNLALAETMRLLDTLRRFLQGDLSETIGVAEAFVEGWRFLRTLTDGVGVEPLVTPQMLLRVEASDEIGIEPAELLNSIYAGVLAENVSVTAGYVAPSGSFTTWAVNTDQGFVTEYQNFAFNSFAPMGNKYIAASSTGLYELNGDDDDGTDIIATLKSGYMQFGDGSQLAGFKGAYLGIRGEGDFYLKLTTGDGKTHTYSVTVESLKTAKVQIGKGVRARYFAFELTSTGQDFDLESVEFLPIVASRRV